MGFDQYHEPPNELSEKTRTFARMIMSVIEEAEAIGWYEQRMSVEKKRQAKAIMKDAQKEEFKHFGMDLEFLLRQKPVWREILQGILFKKATSSRTARKPKKKPNKRAQAASARLHPIAAKIVIPIRRGAERDLSSIRAAPSQLPRSSSARDVARG